MLAPVKITLVLLLSSLSYSTNAWQLSKTESTVSFISVKKTNIGESHHFLEVSGAIKENQALVLIKPGSVETGVPIRNERMREVLFKTHLHPKIEVSADVSDVISSLNTGESTMVNLPAQLKMHGETAEITLVARVSQLSDTKLIVTSTEPVLVRAADFNMVEGILKLSSLVNGLPIAESVPVSFSLVFEKPNDEKSAKAASS